MSIPTESPYKSARERPWQKAYLRYRELQRSLTDNKDQSKFLVLLNNAAEGRRIFDKGLLEYRAVGGRLPKPPADLVDELRGFADLRSSYYQTAGFVFDDVYHLAFDMLTSWRTYGSPIPQASRCSSLHRGQRVDTWGIGASIYRGVPVGLGRESALRDSATAACRVGHAIAARLDLSFVEAMAVAQHYSDAEILGVSTWLVDFSRDPWVSLFFASDRGKTGDFGIVWDIMPTEYASHSAGLANPIGPLQLIVPHGVPRIDNQAGVFIIAGLPEFFDQYVAPGWHTRFRQHTGLRFEDPVLGINAHTIYPPDDKLKAVLEEVRAAVADCGCGSDARECVVPAAVFTDPFDSKTYEGLLNCWLSEWLVTNAGRPEPPGVRVAFAGLARFHARLHSPAYVNRLPDIVSRSFHRLHDAFASLCTETLWGQPVSIRNAVMGSYVNQMTGDQVHVAVLLEALDEIVPSGGA